MNYGMQKCKHGYSFSVLATSPTPFLLVSYFFAEMSSVYSSETARIIFNIIPPCYHHVLGWYVGGQECSTISTWISSVPSPFGMQFFVNCVWIQCHKSKSSKAGGIILFLAKVWSRLDAWHDLHPPPHAYPCFFSLHYASYKSFNVFCLLTTRFDDGGHKIKTPLEAFHCPNVIYSWLFLHQIIQYINVHELCLKSTEKHYTWKYVATIPIDQDPLEHKTRFFHVAIYRTNISEYF